MGVQGAVGGGGRPAAVADEPGLVEALRSGDERSFAAVVDDLSPVMLRVALGYTPSRSVAEEVVQETWLAVLTGLDRFEQRASLRTWVFSILVNIAKTRARRERRSVPFSSAFPDRDSEAGPTVDPGRFRPDGDEWPGHWATPPHRWELPESAALAQEVRTHLRVALDGLPPRQRTVVSLRDIQGFDADEVCTLLGISPGNERVLLHRGRAKLREALEGYLDRKRT